MKEENKYSEFEKVINETALIRIKSLEEENKSLKQKIELLKEKAWKYDQLSK